MESIISAGLLIHIASLIYVVAFVIRSQLLLRALVLIATFLYIGYYYFIPATPLWDAIAWSCVLGLANIYVMGQMLLERTTFRLSDQEKELFEALDTMQPGEFRRLLKITEWRETNEDTTTLTAEGAPCGYLFYVLSGDITIAKKERTFIIGPHAFIGEVAYFLSTDASATVTIPKGSRYAIWERGELTRLEKANPGIRAALHRLLNQDMARKVANSPKVE